MNKNIFSLGAAFTIAASIAFAPMAFAEPVPTSDNPDQPVAINETTDTPQSNCIGNPGANCQEPVVVDSDDEISEPSDSSVTESIDLEGTTGSGIDKEEVAVDCEATPDAEACIEEETPYWPMYVSLGALGAAILVFIILNLFGSKKKK